MGPIYKSQETAQRRARRTNFLQLVENKGNKSLAALAKLGYNWVTVLVV
jgi:hypothetical protein